MATREAMEERKKTPRGKTPHGAESRKKLLDAAVYLICERGIAGTSVGAICDRAGVVKTGLYWHFGSKDGLLLAVVEGVAAEWVEQISRAVFDESEARGRLDRLIDGLHAIVRDHAHLLEIILAINAEPGNVSPAVWEATQSFHDRTIEAIAMGFQSTLDRPLPDLDLVAQTIVAVTHGILRVRRLHPETKIDRMFQDLKVTVHLLVDERTERGRELGGDDE